MAFPRSFKKETWYLRLPSGEIEVASATALQRAFECGLVDLRTPVRAFGLHTWTTMREAADLSTPPSPSLASLSPTSLDTPAPDLVDGAPWRSRTDVDPRLFRASKTPAVVVGLLLSLAFVAFAFLRSEAPARAASAASARMPHVVVRGSGGRSPRRELEHTHNKKVERVTPEKRRRLAELDYITRTQRPKSSIVKPLIIKPRQTSNDPFSVRGARGPNRGDPLDGSI